MKKRICIITTSYPRYKNDASNGGEFIRDFALSLSDSDFDVFILTPFKKDAENYDEKISLNFFPWLNDEVGLSSLNPKNPIHFLRLISVVISGLLYTIRFIKKNKIDLCFAAWAVPSGFFALFAKIFVGTPYFVWSLGSDIYKIKDYPFGRFILNKVLKNATKLFADSMELVHMVEEISKRKCFLLHSGRILDTEIRSIDYTKFDQTKMNFIFLGRYHDGKGIDLLVESIRLLSDEDKKKSLFHIFGGGPLEFQIKQIAKESKIDSITFINDFIDGDKVFSYMSKSDYVIIPSRLDGIPMVLFEAMQANKPLIVTNVGDMGNLVKQHNVGFVVEPNANNIAEGIQRAIRSDKKQRDSFMRGMKELKNELDPRTGVNIFIESLNSA